MAFRSFSAVKTVSFSYFANSLNIYRQLLCGNFLVKTDDNYRDNNAHLLNFRYLLFFLLPVFFHFSQQFSKYSFYVQKNHIFVILVKLVVKFMLIFVRFRTSGFENFPELQFRKILDFWPNFGFHLNHTLSTPNFMGITNMQFILTKAQGLRHCGYFRFTSGFFFLDQQVSFVMCTVLNIVRQILSNLNWPLKF